MYIYKNGLRCLVSDKVKDGFHIDKDISAKIGKNQVRTIKLCVDRMKAGTHIPFNVTFQKITSVKLNNQELVLKIDYVVYNNSEIAFTFNLISSDSIEINGVV